MSPCQGLGNTILLNNLLSDETKRSLPLFQLISPSRAPYKLMIPLFDAVRLYNDMILYYRRAFVLATLEVSMLKKIRGTFPQAKMMHSNLPYKTMSNFFAAPILGLAVYAALGLSGGPTHSSPYEANYHRSALPDLDISPPLKVSCHGMLAMDRGSRNYKKSRSAV